MKTKDFIKMIQEADPTGESYLRCGEGAIYYAEQKPGYYDGPYTYLENPEAGYKDRVLVISTKDNKVDVHGMDIHDIAYEHDGVEEEVFKHIRLEISDARKPSYEKSIKDACQKARNFRENTLHQFTYRVLERLKKGYKIKVEQGRHWKHHYFVRPGEKDSLCGGEITAITNTGGLFKLVGDEYVLDINQG